MTGVPAREAGGEYEAGSGEGDKFREIFCEALRIVILGQVERSGTRPGDPCLTIDDMRDGAERNPSCAASYGHTVQA